MHFGGFFFRIVSGSRKVVRQNREEEELDGFKGVPAEVELNPKCAFEIYSRGMVRLRSVSSLAAYGAETRETTRLRMTTRVWVRVLYVRYRRLWSTVLRSFISHI